MTIDNTVKTMSFLYSIPSAAWGLIGTIIGALIGFVTTKTQLNHTAKERRLDREAEIRREVYLEAAEAIASSSEMLVGLMKANVFSKDFNTTVAGYTAAINKINLIGTPETIKAVANYSAAFSKSTLYLISKKIPLAKLQVDIDLLDSMITNTTALRDEYSAKFHESIRNDPSDIKKSEFFHNMFVDISNRLTKMFNDKVEKSKMQFELLQEFGLEVVNVTASLAPLLKNACISVRNEMGNPIDEKEYENILQEATDKMPEYLKEFYADIRKHIDNK